MAAHGNQPVNQTEEDEGKNSPQENPSTQTYDDRLAVDLYKDHSSQNELFKQLIIALAGGGLSYGTEIINAYNTLKNPLDAEKLVTDPQYKKQVERAVQLVKRYEGSKITDGRSKYKDIVPQTQRAIERTNACHSKLKATKSALLLNDKIYLQQLKATYGLDDKQLKDITSGAWARIQENPSLSIKDALRIEAENFSVRQVTKEVEQENKGKGLTKQEKEAQIKQKLAEKQLQFEEAVKIKTGQAQSEEAKIKSIISSHIEENKQILAAKTQPPQSAPQAQSAPQPVVAPPTSSPPPPQPVIPTPPTQVIPLSPPQSTVIVPPQSMLSSLSSTIRSLPPISSPSFGGLRAGLNILSGGFGKLFGGSLGFIGRRGLGRFINLAGNLGKRAINRALDAFMPGLGMAVGKINDVIKSITGIDVEKTILVGAAILVGVVAAVVIILPLIIGVGVFSYITGNNPLKLSSTNTRTISWYEFDKQYLSLETDSQKAKLGVGDTNPVTWQQFEKDNLTLQKQFLSLEKINP